MVCVQQIEVIKEIVSHVAACIGASYAVVVGKVGVVIHALPTHEVTALVIGVYRCGDVHLDGLDDVPPLAHLADVVRIVHHFHLQPCDIGIEPTTQRHGYVTSTLDVIKIIVLVQIEALLTVKHEHRGMVVRDKQGGVGVHDDLVVV